MKVPYVKHGSVDLDCRILIWVLRYMNLFLSTWALLIAGLIFSLPMIHLRVKDHTDVEDEVL